MNDEEPGDHAPAESQPSNPDWLTWTPEDIKNNLEKYCTEKGHESPTDRAARSTANATWAVAFLTFVLASVGVAQWCVLSGTLAEMADEQRPWIYADIGSGGKIYRNQSGGLTIPIEFKLHNTGHLPAFYVAPDIEGYLSGANGESASTTARKKQVARCAKKLQQPAADDQIGVTVFPGQEVDMVSGVGIAVAEIESFKSYNSNLGQFLFPWVIGCVRYRSPDGGYHQTGVVISIGMHKHGSSMTFALPFDPTGVDPENVVMSPWIEGGTAYAN